MKTKDLITDIDGTILIREKQINGEMKYFHSHSGLLHRLGGPAHIDSIGNQSYFKNGKYHNDKGPARGRTSGQLQYWIDGQRINKLEWILLHRINPNRKEFVDLLHAKLIRNEPFYLDLVRKGLARTGMKEKEIDNVIRVAKLNNIL